MQATDACPCGSGELFGRCCLALHRGERQAATAEELMRSRYSAYAVGDADYIWRTWHPSTRPAASPPDGELSWTGLDVVDVVHGGVGDETGEVEFRAHFRDGRQSGALHERSRFAVRARRWFYVDGELFD
ncbi:YchJ family protein [Mycolicibacterium sp. CBM1]